MSRSLPEGKQILPAENRRPIRPFKKGKRGVVHKKLLLLFHYQHKMLSISQRAFSLAGSIQIFPEHLRHFFSIRNKLFLFIFIIFLNAAYFLSIGAKNVFSEPVPQPHVEASLLSEKSAIRPEEKTLFVGLHFVIDPQWHVYWKYAGDSGAEPKFHWLLNGEQMETPPEILWPVPKRFRLGSFTNYGYSPEVLFLSKITLPKGFEKHEALEITLDAEWLVCKEECIPGNALFVKTLPVKNSEVPEYSEHKDLFDRTRKQLPIKHSQLTSEISFQEETFSVLLKNFPEGNYSGLSFIPDKPGLIENSLPQILTLNETTIQLQLPKAKNLQPGNGFLSGVLIKHTLWPGEYHGVQIRVPFSLEKSESPAPLQRPVENKHSVPAFWFILLLAFGGGLILNLMPCVFPILSMKIMSFVESTGKAKEQIRLHGFFFTAGVIFSFWVLTILIIALQIGGEQLGWGFQLQNPLFVSLLVLILIGVALNFFGVFEAGTTLQRLGGKFQVNENGPLGSFASGILATVLATPCTAPFMGTAIAYALTSGIVVSFLVFTALGAGFAAPYLLLTLFPGWLSHLPRPGQWMVHLKQFMGFPILFTALWLLWVLEKQTEGHLFSVLFSCILFSLTLWGFQLFTAPERRTLLRRAGFLFLITGVGISIYFALPSPRKTPTLKKQNVEFETDQYGQQWLPYSAESLKELKKQRLPIFVDFTAAWCVTCQFNKKVVFSSQEVRDLIQSSNTILVKADWTNQNPEITRALESFGKAGVPLNVLYFPESKNKEPVIFPSLLTPGIVLEELRKLG